MAKKSRKLILVRSDLLEQAAKITAKEGRTLFSFTNDIFEQAIKAYEMSVTLAEALEFYRMITIGKHVGYAVIPQEIFRHMTKKLCTVEREELLKKWHESGFWSGSYLKVKFKNNFLETLRKFLKAVLWNLDEISINTNQDKIYVKCFSPNISLECTEMISKFIEGIFNSFGYVVEHNSCLRGIIAMKLKPKEKDTKDTKETKLFIDIEN